MERIKKIFVRIHFVLWVLFGLLAALQISQDTPRWLSLTAGFMLTCLYVFYSHFQLLTHYPGKKNRGAYVPRLALIMLTGPLPLMLLHYRQLDFGTYTIHLFSTVIVFAFLGWLARITENLFINTVKKEQLEKQAIASELYYLKSQMAPHFLFNTLNNIHTLVYKQAPTAPDAVMQLASLMRYMIYESNAPTVPLTREVAYLQDYMSLQQLRYKQGPVVAFNTVGVTESCHIAPLLFIHLLENAYKHSPARLLPGDLQVKVEVSGDTLTFSVHNPMSHNQPRAFDEPGGIGLPNVRKRLALLYPDQHELAIDQDGDRFFVVLKIRGLQSQCNERKTQLLYH